LAIAARKMMAVKPISFHNAVPTTSGKKAVGEPRIATGARSRRARAAVARPTLTEKR